MKNKLVNFRLNEEDMKVYKSFKNDVWQKYGQINGVLGHEVTQAIRLYRSYLNSSIDVQQHTRADKKQRLRNIMERMIVYKYTNEACKRDIELFIKKEGVKDKRTVNDYFKALIDYGFIRHDRFSIYKIHPSKMPRVIT